MGRPRGPRRQRPSRSPGALRGPSRRWRTPPRSSEGRVGFQPCAATGQQPYRGGAAGPGGSIRVTREEQAKFVAQCREVVLALGRLEGAMGKLDERLTKEEQKDAMKDVFEWLGATTGPPPPPPTRGGARGGAAP